MVAQITLLSEPIIDSLNMNQAEFEEAASRFGPDLQVYGATANLLAEEVNVLASNASAAAASLSAALWVSGTTYTAGVVVYSPIDKFNYRRKVTGAGTTDPSNDPTNWALLTATTNGGADTTSSAVDIVLTSGSGRLQIITMSAAAKKVTLPAATTLSKGATIFLIRNTGIFRFSVHKNGGGFLCYIQPGQSIVFNCSDIGTSTGVWHVAGAGVDNIYSGNAAEVLSAVDSRSIVVANLSATKAICAFRNNVNGFIHAVVLNFGSASGTSAAINAEVSDYLSIAAQTASQATVVYKGPTGTTKGLVLDISGNTITPGAIATIDAVTTTGTFTGLTALTSSKLLCVYSGAASGTVRERVLDIAASAITAAAEVVADASNAQADTRRMVGTVSATKALVGYKQNGVTSIVLRLQSISVSTPAPTGTALALSMIGGTVGTSMAMAVLSTTRALIVHSSDLNYADLVFYLVDVSGTSPVLLATQKTDAGIKTSSYPRMANLDANNVYVSWNGSGSDAIDGLHVRITGDDKIIIGNQSEKTDTSAANADGYVNCVALDSTHVMQVCRNASTFLSAKTIEIAT